MQIKSLRIKSYRSWLVNESVISEVAKERENKILLFNQLRAEGCSEITTLVAIETSRATLYRWKRQYTQKGVPGLLVKNKRPKNTRKLMWTNVMTPSILHSLRN